MLSVHVLFVAFELEIKGESRDIRRANNMMSLTEVPKVLKLETYVVTLYHEMSWYHYDIARKWEVTCQCRDVAKLLCGNLAQSRA